MWVKAAPSSTVIELLDVGGFMRESACGRLLPHPHLKPPAQPTNIFSQRFLATDTSRSTATTSTKTPTFVRMGGWRRPTSTA